MAYEWFISYRRKTGGESQAQKVAEILSKYVGKDKVFYDRESMREGNDWSEQIDAALDTAKHFVLLVNEASADEDQSNNKGGYWYEIETALNLNKEITLIEYDKKSYEEITTKYTSLKRVQRVTFNGEYNFAFEERLCKHFGFEYKVENTSVQTVIHNITIPENLIPRRDMLDKLNNEFNSHQCVVISGIGGSGKTSLAYLYIKEQNFNNVAWVIVNGKIEDVFLDRIAGLLFSKEDNERFTRTNDKQTKLDIIKSVLSKIQGKNLLVFDINTNNAEIKQEIENEIHNYLPTSNNWKTIVLTRVLAKNKNWFVTIPMETMSKEIAITLFNNNYEGYVDFTDEQLAEIVNKLYYHPLLIEHTAKVYTNEFGITAEEIINQINDNIVNNERTKKALSGLAKNGKEQQDIYTYLTNLCNIKKLSEAEVKFLAVFVTWPEEPIDFEVIDTLLPKQKDILNNLINKGIIRYNKQFSIHSLMADVLREQININEFDYTEYFDTIQKFLDDEIKRVTLHKYSKYIASSFINYGICGDVKLFSDYLNQSCTYHDEILFKWPESVFTNIVKKLEEDADPFQVVHLYNAVAGVERLKYNLSDAKSHYEKALEIMESVEGNEDSLNLKGNLLNNIAMLEGYLGDTDSAKKHFDKSLGIARKLPKTPQYLYSLAITLDNLAYFKKGLGDTDSAKKHYKESLEIKRKQPETPQYLDSLLTTLDNFAFFEELDLGDTDSAKKHFQESVVILRKLPGTPHYLDKMACIYEHLAILDQYLHDIDSAKKHYEESLKIRRKLPETPRYLYWLAMDLNRLAYLEKDLGDTDSAKKHYEELVETYRKLPERPQYWKDRATSLTDYARLEEKLGDTDSAKKHYEESLEIFRKLTESPLYLESLAKTLRCLADLEKKLGDTDSAKKHCEEGLKIARQINDHGFYIFIFEEMLSSLTDTSNLMTRGHIYFLPTQAT